MAQIMVRVRPTAVSDSTTRLEFSEDSAIYRNSDNLNILGIKRGATVTISAVTVPSPTPAPTIAPYLTPSITPAPAPVSANRVFVTSTDYFGHLMTSSQPGGVVGYQGLSLADYRCQESANASGLGGTWKAWLSDSKTSAASRLTHSSGPYKRLDGKVVANNWEDLTDGSLQTPINITEQGSTKNGTVWTNTSVSGERVSTDPNKSCKDWTEGYFGGSSASIGISYNISTWWTYYDQIGGSGCNNQPWPLYCFEQAAAAPFPSPVATPLPGTGDGNNNGRIDLGDMSVLLTDINKTSGFRVNIDMNGDGKINTFDFSLMRNLLIQKGVIKG